MTEMELVARLRARANSYRLSSPSAVHTSSLLDEAADALSRMSAPVGGLETTEAVREGWLAVIKKRLSQPGNLMPLDCAEAILRDFSRLQAEVARLRDEASDKAWDAAITEKTDG